MVRLILIAVISVFGLSACVTDNIVQDTSRKAAKSVITPIIEEKFPGRNAAVYSECVIDNATTNEIFSLAKAAVTGPDADAVTTVVGIVARRGTIECILKAELATGLR
ncbi:MAG TPA: hypothetical protein DD729_06145 [Rhodobacteraceae bacterium]|jgi:hypothetical protein|nr:hypothetical protein [Paracoccaceae bacterium]